MKGRQRCRMHGGKNTGAPKGEANGNYVSGEWTNEAIAARRFASVVIRAAKGASLAG
ncbi:hypothetical protein [uncultured Parasphingopyxis sp.]|uniref:hypothetical protein n=1 Tax=uncultured Parasphingopyxis sp. TaxID=1547918 RepID=UPI00345BD99E